LLQSLQESGIADLHLRIVRSVGHKRANAAHFLALLRARREWPHSRRAHERDELASVMKKKTIGHGTTPGQPPVLPTEIIAHPDEAGDCCAAGFNTAAPPSSATNSRR
jgi:hypothetical protein